MSAEKWRFRPAARDLEVPELWHMACKRGSLMPTRRHRRVASACLVLLSLASLAGCAPQASDEDSVETDGSEPSGQRGDAYSSGSVDDAVEQSCTTSSVKGLSLQIIAEGRCLTPGAFEPLPPVQNAVYAESVFPYLEGPARDALVAALNAAPSRTMTIHSMLRTVAQQYLLYHWYTVTPRRPPS